MKRFSLYLLLAVSIAAIGLVSCKKDEDQPLPPVSPVIITDITIVDAPESLEVAAPQQINITLTPKEPARKKVNWTSSDSTVATVDENGVVSPLTMGDVTITVKADTGNAQASCDIKVVAPALDDGKVKEKLEALYASLCQVYGDPYYYASLEIGTDEATYGAEAELKYIVHDMTDTSVTPTNCGSSVLWEQAFPAINVANYIINFASENDKVTKSLVAEARFFRAFWYFQLVQTFGGVPFDLGAGDFEYNMISVVPGKRKTVADVYTRCIFPDLVKAVEELDAPRLNGYVSKTAARLVLSKAYLTYGWWLANPNNIPTYPECTRQQSEAKDYFQKAYNTAKEGIDNPGKYKLCTSFYDANVAANDGNNEIILWADHKKHSSTNYNLAGSLMNWDYTKLVVNRIPMVITESSQYLGYPMTYMAPTKEGIKNFTNIDKDSRWDASFTSMYYCRWDLTKYPLTEVTDSRNTFKTGNRLLTFFPEEKTYQYPKSLSDMDGASVAAYFTDDGQDNYAFGLEGISRRVFPALWKLGSDGTGGAGSGTTRPFAILKFSELYLIEAEAAVYLGNQAEASKFVKIIRDRAAAWNYLNNERKSITFEKRELDTPASVDLKYVLDERFREYYGEGYRWLDLVRTQMWNERAGTYTICGSALGDVTPKTYTRNIHSGHYLRPIPQSQIDLLKEKGLTGEELKEYQNPQYQEPL